MNNEIIIDVNQISAIARITGNEPFDFEQRCRKWDGFVFFIKGNGSFCDFNGKTYDIHDSSLVLLHQNQHYKFSIAPGYDYITTAYTLTQDKRDDIDKLPSVFTLNAFQKIEVEDIWRVWQKNLPDGYMRCKIDLIKLYLNFIERFSENAFLDTDVKRAIEFIHSNFKRNYSGDELAKYCGVSKSYLRLKFRTVIGQSATAYRNELRLNTSIRMLQSGLFTIKEVAYELGYCDVYHFTKNFTKKTGLTPSSVKYSKHSFV